MFEARHQYYRAWLPSPEILQGCIKAIIQVFENVGEMEVLKIRWEEIKKLQVQPTLT